jgi:hypothetical protein
MPLVAEEIGPSAEGRRLVALAHTGVQNGDVMHDPEIVFEFHALGAEPISFRNDYVGAHDGSTRTTTLAGARVSTRSGVQSSSRSRGSGSATCARRASSAKARTGR